MGLRCLDLYPRVEIFLPQNIVSSIFEHDQVRIQDFAGGT